MALRQRGTEQDVVLDRDCIGLGCDSRLYLPDHSLSVPALTVTHKDVGLIPVLALRATLRNKLGPAPFFIYLLSSKKAVQCHPRSQGQGHTHGPDAHNLTRLANRATMYLRLRNGLGPT
jgi:hypothetical protein